MQELYTKQAVPEPAAVYAMDLLCMTGGSYAVDTQSMRSRYTNKERAVSPAETTLLRQQ